MYGLNRFTVESSRGRRWWARCDVCRSYTDTTPYDRAEEAKHQAVGPTGRLETGLYFDEYKSHMFRSVLGVLAAHTERGATLLDVGCSYGGFLKHASERGYRVSGMDIAEHVVDHVRSRGFSCQVAASVGDLDIPDASLDVVSALDCNCYWPDQGAELGAIRRKLRVGGFLMMRVVDKSWLLTFGLAVRRWLPRLGQYVAERAVNDHLASIPVRAVLQVLRREGFDVILASPRGALHSPNSSLAVRLMFAWGFLMWRVTGRYLAPGCIILAKKRSSGT